MSEIKKSNPNQLSLFDLLPGGKPKDIDNLSADDWFAVMEAAREKYLDQKVREKAEQKQKKAEEEKRRQEEEEHARSRHIEEVTCMDLPLDWNNLYSFDECAAGVHADSISDGLILSLIHIGEVDIEYIAQVSGGTYKEVIEALRGAIFQNPEHWDECFYRGWETADEYLSGNLMRKYNTAREANKKYNGHFKNNTRAIREVLPAAVSADEIYVTVGSPWVPPDIIDDFIVHLLGKNEVFNRHSQRDIPVREQWPTVYEPVTGTWEIPYKRFYNHTLRSTVRYGTQNMKALDIIEKTLNMKALQVYDTVTSKAAAPGKKRTLNKARTMAVQEKQQLIIKTFQEWIWTDKHRKKRLETIYESKFSCVRRRIFDGGFLTFPGLSPSVTLYPYQKNAVARILFTPNTLLAHSVGAGKTYIMAAAGMELRRMHISRKNVYVVPNNIVGQWESIFRQMYPEAKLLAVEPKTFTPNKRQAALETIRDGDFDAIIIAYSCFELIPMSRAYYEQMIEAEMGAIQNALKAAGENPRLKKKRDNLAEKLKKVQGALEKTVPAVCFDDLGINTLFVDEAHNFKNITIESKIDKVLGINKTGSSKCNEMLHKVRCVQSMNEGRGVIFATGTPITNSVTDIFVMQTYLQYGELRFLDLHHFDNWAGTFGEQFTEFEIDVDTSAYRMATRFSKFHNLPELTNLLAQIADFHKTDSTAELPEFTGYDDKLIPKTYALTDYLKDITGRAEMIRQGLVKRTEDNMLKLTTDGRKAALDMRLAEPATAFSYDSKVFRCMENVLNIYRNTAEQRLTQLVFCDTSTPKAGFNIYDELKSLLAGSGIPEEEIAFVHEYDTEKQRAGLFSKMRSGEIRVLMGSTFKLGMGVNVQKKLVAIHHLDVPWRPADMIQREGRILRQGNENKSVQIVRYITDGSFDAYSWQLLESKQRFISQMLSGSVTERSASDVDDVVLNYAEIKALAIGNPLIKERVETANKLKRACILQNKLTETRIAMKKELFELPGQTAHTTDVLEKALLDWELYTQSRKEIKEMKDHRQYGAAILAALTEHTMQPDKKLLFTYQGFSIALPSNMPENKPAVWIEGHGRYYTEMGDSDIGCISRVDNKLNSLPSFIEEKKQKLQALSERKADMEAELAKEQSYTAEIEHLREKLRKLDKKLGVDTI